MCVRERETRWVDNESTVPPRERGLERGGIDHSCERIV